MVQRVRWAAFCLLQLLDLQRNFSHVSRDSSSWFPANFLLMQLFGRSRSRHLSKMGVWEQMWVSESWPEVPGRSRNSSVREEAAARARGVPRLRWFMHGCSFMHAMHQYLCAGAAAAVWLDVCMWGLVQESLVPTVLMSPQRNKMFKST